MIDVTIKEKYIIIPDLHGQYNKLIEVLSKVIEIKNGIIINNNDFKIIFLGDFIDKGDIEETKKLIKFINNNRDKIKATIIGNHEDKVIKFLNGYEIKRMEYHDFIPIIVEDEEIKKDFLKLYEESVVFYEDDYVYCNHSPCTKLTREKKDRELLIKTSFAGREQYDSNEEFESYLYKFFNSLSNDRIGKYQFTGHLELKKVIINYNQVWLDTKVEKELNICVIENEKMRFENNTNNNDNYIKIDNDKDVNKVIINSFYKIK